METITAERLLELIADNEELALIDVREQGEFASAHLLLASCLPLSRMELVLADLVPRHGTRIVLIGSGPSDPYRLTQRASERLIARGYSDVAVLADGIEGWRQAGQMLFSGVNTLSKAFGEYVETTYGTPHIGAGALREKMKGGEDIVVFDARPADEFRNMNIPGAFNVPGAELVHRFFESVKRPETLVVVNCAGRTRSIIGAQSLINAGVPNRVMALRNGTMGWHLAGFELERGQLRPAPPPGAAAGAEAKACARGVAGRFGVQYVEGVRLAQWQRDGAATLYILDVRSPEEYAAGHLPGSRNAPGGQLVQATDEYVAVRKARIVLVDDTETRAVMTASWLVQMGWRDVFVLSGGIGKDGLDKGPESTGFAGFEELPTVSPAQLSRQPLSAATAVVDVADSRTYRKAHIPGAYWAVRARMAADLAPLAPFSSFVFTSADGRLAHLAAGDLKAARPEASVRVLAGGTAAWFEAGLPAEQGVARALSKVDDVCYKPYELADAQEKAMQDYLAWEVGLVEKLEKDGTVVFPAF